MGDPTKPGPAAAAPLITFITPISVRQQTAEDKAECYSSDLQQIHIELRVLFRVPESSVVKLFRGEALKQNPSFVSEGFGTKAPFLSNIVNLNVRQQTQGVNAACFSSDLQQVVVDLRVLYRVPEKSVVEIYQQFAGDPFDSLIAPRVQEALKEVTALPTAEQIVEKREEVKQKALAAARHKIGHILRVEDIVLRDIHLSGELERAIEAKMFAEQQAAQARFTQVQTQVKGFAIRCRVVTGMVARASYKLAVIAEASCAIVLWAGASGSRPLS